MKQITSCRDLAKSDTPNARFEWLMVTNTQGTVILDTASEDQVTLTSVPVGIWIPTGTCTNVRVASTADGFMVA